MSVSSIMEQLKTFVQKSTRMASTEAFVGETVSHSSQIQIITIPVTNLYNTDT